MKKTAIDSFERIKTKLSKMASLKPEKSLKALVAYHALQDENPMDFFGYIREEGSEVLFYYNEEENAGEELYTMYQKDIEKLIANWQITVQPEDSKAGLYRKAFDKTAELLELELQSEE